MAQPSWHLAAAGAGGAGLTAASRLRSLQREEARFELPPLPLLGPLLLGPLLLLGLLLLILLLTLLLRGLLRLLRLLRLLLLGLRLPLLPAQPQLQQRGAAAADARRRMCALSSTRGGVQQCRQRMPAPAGGGRHQALCQACDAAACSGRAGRHGQPCGGKLGAGEVLHHYANVPYKAGDAGDACRQRRMEGR